MEDKSYNEALSELVGRLHKDLTDEIKTRSHNIIGHTVASAVVDMPDGAAKEAVREGLFVAKVIVLLMTMRDMGLYSLDEYAELKDHLMAWNATMSHQLAERSAEE